MNNQAKSGASLTNQSRAAVVLATGGEVFFGWMFLFTQSVVGSGRMTNQARTSGALINQAKS